MSAVTAVEDLTMRVRGTRRSLDRDVGEARALAEAGKSTLARIAALRHEVEVCEKAIGVLTSIGEARHRDAQEKVEALVTSALQQVFEEDLTFHLVSSVRGKASVVDFIVRSHLADGRTIDTPILEARGGGLAACVGFLLRLVLLLLSPQQQDAVLFLDETFAHLSAEYEDGMGAFIKELTERTGIQVILVTHSPTYGDYADTAYRFALEDGTTKVKRESK